MRKLIVVLFFLTCQWTVNAQFFDKIKNTKIKSDQSIEWKNFGPGMSGYCEEFWCHPTDPNVMFMGPDMHVSFGTWNNGKSWHTLKDSDGLGLDMKRVLDIEFSLQSPDFGMAIDWNGWIYETKDRGRIWNKTGSFGEHFNAVGTDFNDTKAFSRGYPEQRGMRHGELAIDSTNDNVWYVGAGDFWNVKNNHRSITKPNGPKLRYAAYGYIWKTTDKGKTWQKITNGLSENTEVGKIIVNPNKTNHVIMITNLGLMLSKDGGLTWEKNTSGLPNNLPRDLTSYYNKETKEFVLYLVDQTVYEDKGNTVASKGGVYKSTNGGLNWINITGNLAFDLNSVNAPAEIDRFHKTVAYWFGISKNDSKSKFTKLPSEALPVFNRLVVNPLNKDEIYVSYNKKHDFTFGPGDVWKTEDGGETWIVCARQGAYWKSGENAQYWKKRKNPIGTNIQFGHLQRYMDTQNETSGNRMMTINSKGDVFIGIDQQTLKTTDNGKTWKQVDDFETSPGSKKWIGRGGSDLPGRFMLHETGVKDRRLFCSGEHGLWQTTDLDGWPDKQAVALKQIEGQTFEGNGYHAAHSISTVAVHPNNPNIIYILIWRQNHMGKVRRSIDGGKTWENIAEIFTRKKDGRRFSENPVAYQNSLLFDPKNPNTMYFCATRKAIQEIHGSIPEDAFEKGQFGIYRSTDMGFTWSPINMGLPESSSVRRITLHPDNSEVIYAALNDKNGGLFKSKDKGDNWEKVKIPSQIKTVNNIFIDPNTKTFYIATGSRSGTYKEGGVWKSLDNGKSWKKIFKAPYVWQVETSPVNPKLIVISVPGYSKSSEFMNPGVYISKDEGESWNKINKGLGQPDKIVDVKPDPYNENVLWCASWGCGWYVAYLNGTTKGW